MLTVYGRATSSNVQALLWGMEEMGLVYERVDYGEVHGGLDTPEFAAMNPHRRIPVLKVGDTALFETGAILRYLATRHAPDSFWPADPLARAQVDMWAEWAKYEVAARFTGPVFWRNTRTAPERRDPALIARNLARFEDALARAEPRVTSHPYLCGEALTLADIQLGHVLYRYFDTDLARRALPGLGAYYARLTTRPAYRATVMVSYDVLRNTF
ncbi:glutathione S-transferase family protein [Marimonas arenosa]|uniref:Glutathione S-transferase family protein n=1 Tax=Marimonas arenosa TaxID=1795305 RepID=A0AAE4B1Q9_9RHOB|nr:glutathione S-transferase family protein [Marimonas arenosa]MDQ2088308.1 glutathione S-transferase family protein [Marimonas arenosa]